MDYLEKVVNGMENHFIVTITTKEKNTLVPIDFKLLLLVVVVVPSETIMLLSMKDIHLIIVIQHQGYNHIKLPSYWIINDINIFYHHGKP
jgi:hypothetical protein